MELVLASSSQRRQDLLEEAHIPFRVEAPHIDEWTPESHPEYIPQDLALANARRKADVISLRNPTAAVLAADTMVVCQDRILGKPADLDEARRMLGFLSGKTHAVMTAAVLMVRPRKTVREHVAQTCVHFRTLDTAAIRAYLERVHVLDKAGAYAYQDRGEDIVEQVEGSTSNIIGLPMEIVLPWIEEL
jgi:septum formation protein